MNIAKLLTSPGAHMSCEIFPPKDVMNLDKTKAVAAQIAALSPAFISVTYGAGGNTPHFTREVALNVEKSGVPALAHLTCINDVKPKIDTVLAELEQAGIDNVLALRGDLVDGREFPGDDHFRYAYELIEAIKKRGGFCVGAACYPEGHPEAPSKDADLDHLRRKVDAGADFLTTQMFFDNTVLYNFYYRALQKGVAVPITAGIMPVCSGKQIKRIVALSGCSLPPRFLGILDKFGDDPKAMYQAGIAFATEQIIDLLANGVTRIHLYTMNKPDIASEIFGNLSHVLKAVR